MTSAPTENAALVRQFLTAVVASEDTDAVELFLTEDVDGQNLVFRDGQRQEAITALGRRILAGADVTVEVEDIVATDDRVAVRATVTGTHRESLSDVAPAGESFEIACAWFCRIDDGQIAEIWSLPDSLGLMEQLGAIPERPPNRSHIHLTDHQ